MWCKGLPSSQTNKCTPDKKAKVFGLHSDKHSLVLSSIKKNINFKAFFILICSYDLS